VELTAWLDVPSGPLRTEGNLACDKRSVEQTGQARIGEEPKRLGRSDKDMF